MKVYYKIKISFLKPLPILKYYWRDILINFITLLPKYRRYRRIYKYIIIVINKLSKKRRFIGIDSLEIKSII